MTEGIGCYDLGFAVCFLVKAVLFSYRSRIPYFSCFSTGCSDLIHRYGSLQRSCDGFIAALHIIGRYTVTVIRLRPAETAEYPFCRFFLPGSGERKVFSNGSLEIVFLFAVHPAKEFIALLYGIFRFFDLISIDYRLSGNGLVSVLKGYGTVDPYTPFT